MMKLLKVTTAVTTVATVFAQEDVEINANGAIEEVPEESTTSTIISEENPNAEKHEFQAEVSRLMDIIINSLYTDKLVFLRELISNSADALEKVRYLSVADETYLGETKDLEIKIEFDSNAKTLSIIDTGVGMTKADLINNLGTVAKSGTTNFLESMAEGGDTSNLIGQFGVGFYSAFLVADKVTVTSKNNDDEGQWIWESSADASFSIAEDADENNRLGRGSRLTLHLKEDALDLLDERKLKELATKFSQFIQFPIYVKSAKEIEVEDDSEEEEDEEETDEEEVTEEDEEKEEKPKKMKKETVHEWEQVNTQKAIWLRSKDDVTEEEYTEFYKGLTSDYTGPMTQTHFNAEGDIDFKSLLFVPEKAPHDMMDNYWTKKSDVKLYVRRVLVAENFDELLPKYLNFVKGVVDSDDLPLNVSREQLQQNKVMKVITKKLVRKVLDLLKKLSKEDDDSEEESEKDKKEESTEEESTEEDSSKKEEKKKPEGPTKYEKFYKEFGKCLKMGAYEDDANRSKIAKLLRFTTTKSEGKEISLDKYIDNMQEKQESIYFASGEDLEILKKLPNLQIFNKKNIEVLLLTDSLDEPVIQKLTDYEGKKFVSIQKHLDESSLPVTEDEQKRHKKMTEYYKPLCTWWKEKLNNSAALKSNDLRVDDVVISKRLTESPCVVVSPQYAYSPQQEKVMRAQTFSNKDSMSFMMKGKTLEINGDHPVIHDLLKKVKEENAEDNMNKAAEDIAITLFQTAMLESGFEVQDNSDFSNRVFRLMSQQLGVDPEAEVKDIELPEEEEEETVAEEETEEETDSSEEEDEENNNTADDVCTAGDSTCCAAEGGSCAAEESTEDEEPSVSLDEVSTAEEEVTTTEKCEGEEEAHHAEL